MTDKAKLLSLWNSLNADNLSKTKELFEKNTDALIEFLLTNILDQDKFEIALFEEGRQRGSMIIYRDANNSKEIEIRLKKNASYEIILTLEGLESEIYVLRTKLNSDEVRLLPEIIQTRMYTVREIEMPVTFLNSVVE